MSKFWLSSFYVPQRLSSVSIDLHFLSLQRGALSS
jgi:hypothetical protein